MKKSEKLEKLKQTCLNCQACVLGTTRNNIVFSDGNPDTAKAMVKLAVDTYGQLDVAVNNAQVAAKPQTNVNIFFIVTNSII